MQLTRINNRWEIFLPEHRSVRPEWQTGWEVKRIESMMKNLMSTDIVYDIGTEEGDISALLATKLTKGGIVLFEPNPHVWPNIRAIWQRNNLKMPLGYFVGFASNSVDLNPVYNDITQGEQNGWPICAYGEIIGNHGFRKLNEQADATPQIKLDSFAIDCPPPDIMTIDVEGAEFEVLRGSQGILQEKKPLVYVSVHPEFMITEYDTHAIFLFKYMWELGYKHTILDFDHEWHVVFEHPEGRRLI